MSWDWECWRFWPSWSRRPVARAGLSATSFSLSSSRPVSLSRFECRPPSLWQVSWRAAFVAIGLLYATCACVAEWNYLRVWNGSLSGSARVRSAVLAAAVFPLDGRNRLAPAHFYSTVRYAGSREIAIELLRAALVEDPYAIDLRRNLAGFLLEAGDRAGAERELAFVAQFSPRSRIVLWVNVNPETGGDGGALRQ